MAYKIEYKGKKVNPNRLNSVTIENTTLYTGVNDVPPRVYPKLIKNSTFLTLKEEGSIIDFFSQKAETKATTATNSRTTKAKTSAKAEGA